MRKWMAAMMAVAALLTTPAAAEAQETIDIGVLRNEDLHVVQKILYPKTGRTEVGIHLGWMAFDPLVTSPNLQFSLDFHRSEVLAISVMVGGGYGFKTLKYLELESPQYGVAPYAFRYLAGAHVGVDAAPIYAKMKLGGRSVVHFDVYGTARVGAALEQSVIPGGGFTVAPAVTLGVGTRFFTSEKMAVRVELRDDLMVEYRPLTKTTHFKQNANITIGLSFMGKAKGER